MAEPFRRLSEVEEAIVTGKGLKGLLRGISWTRKLKAIFYLVPFPSNRWQYSMLALASGAKRKVLHSYPVGMISALGFLKFDRLPAERGLHDVVQTLHCSPSSASNPTSTKSRYSPLAFRIASARANCCVAPASKPTTRLSRCMPGVPIRSLRRRSAGRAGSTQISSRGWSPKRAFARCCSRARTKRASRTRYLQECRRTPARASCAPRGSLGITAGVLERRNPLCRHGFRFGDLAAAVGRARSRFSRPPTPIASAPPATATSSCSPTRHAPPAFNTPGTAPIPGCCAASRCASTRCAWTTCSRR